MHTTFYSSTLSFSDKLIFAKENGYTNSMNTRPNFAFDWFGDAEYLIGSWSQKKWEL